MKWTPARVGLAAVAVVAGLYVWDAVMRLFRVECG